MSHIKRTIILATVITVAVACGGDANTAQDTIATSTSVAPAATTTTTAPPTTTSTVPPTTTTTSVAVEGANIHVVFTDYMTAIVAKDWESASDLATESAGDYVAFVSHLDAISSQPDWQLKSATEPDCCEAVEQASGQFAAATSIEYTEPGGASLAVSNPLVTVEESSVLLADWGVDLDGTDTGPALSQRLHSLSPAPFDPSVCTSDGQWAYLPGGSDLSETVRVILIGSVCDTNSSVTPDPSRMTIFTADSSLNVVASTVLWEDGPEPIPVGERRLFLAIFDVPADQIGDDLFAGAGMTPSGGPNYSFTIEIGPFDLS